MIIGVDFGNTFSFPCCIPSFDEEENRLLGTPLDLLPYDRNDGIPSVFFYSDKARGSTPLPWCGMNAITGRATPLSNRIRNLKRNLGRPLKLDSWEGSYDIAIVQLIEHIVREANIVLENETGETTNLISLGHPVSFNRAQCAHLKSLAEQATLKDGRHIVVKGMIPEPAAAALDYLVVRNRTNRETTVLTYDLGGGTFDAAIVSAYPQGKTRENGKRYFHDVDSQAGLELGGIDFDMKLRDILRARLGAVTISDESLLEYATSLKHDLTREDEAFVEFVCPDGQNVRLTVTREEFEAAVMSLVNATMREVRSLLEDPGCKKPELIVLTGGASQMPIIKKRLAEEFPEYKGKIKTYRPSRAVAYGAARFGEDMDDLQQRTARDIGILFRDNGRDHVITCIPKNTPVPFRSTDITSYTRRPNMTSSVFSVYEAKNDTVSGDSLDDFKEIMSVTLNYAPCSANTAHTSRLECDESGILTVSAMDGNDVATQKCHLKYLI